jgi:hypothetical protein
MTIQVTKSAKTLEEGVQNLIEGSKLDYAKWTEKGRAEGSSYYDETLANFEKNCSVREGQNYIKVIRENAVHAFVIKKLTAKTEAKGFKVGF